MSDETQAFWDAAAEGRLLVERCDRCGAESFPPRGMCRACRSRSTAPVEVTGPGTVYSFTVNHQRWLPDLEVPYAVVLVAFADHPGVRVVGRLRGVDPGDVTIGLPVEVGFEPGPGGFAIPSFVARATPGDHPPIGSAIDHDPQADRTDGRTDGATSDATAGSA